jgi:hypothetical protein
MTTQRIMNICFGSTNPHQPDKKFYSQHGILVFGTNDKGEERISLKLSSLPIDPDFNGWLSVFPPKDKATVSNANPHDATGFDAGADDIDF